MSERIKTIALTIGDPNGIGPDIAVKAAAQLLGSTSDIAGQNKADPAALLRTLRLIGNVPSPVAGAA